MSVKLIAGASGSGKSTYVCEHVIKAAEENPKQSYLIIVPDQFTMQTQADFVGRSSGKGIMNIEILSFSRLAHRVFEETGGNGRPVLDDTGKNLILRRCAAEAKDALPYLAGKLNKPGYIHEVKSAISEFMQYGVGPNELNGLIEYAGRGNKITLVKKLKDLSVLYGLFREYISDRYITTEDALDVLAKDIYKCHIVRDSVVVFDGFTGFTPVQNRVLDAIIECAEDVVFTLTIEPDMLNRNSSTETVNESELFAFTYKSFRSLEKLASEHGQELEIVALRSGVRFAKDSGLSYLERQLFRFTDQKYDNVCDDIHIEAHSTIRDDVRGMAAHIKELIRDKGICYRDIAVITGNLEAYAGETEEVLGEYGIPYYLDRNRGIVQNPFVEYIKAALDIIASDYAYDPVFRFLRTGFTGIDRDDIDVLDNYVTATGIRGLSAYNKPFYKTTHAMRTRGSADDELKRLNRVREELISLLRPFKDAGIVKGRPMEASVYARAVYELATMGKSADRLSAYADIFAGRAEYAMEREYAQIYRLTMELLEQIHELIGSEAMEPVEFLRLMEAGFDEIKVGVIPQSVDRVIIGDMERSRLKNVRYLFFLGLNDGWIPKDTGRGGIISDADREFLSGSDIELSPTPRSQVYIDRFYLYMNLTKPSEGLYLSYVATDGEMRSVRPSYVTEHIGRMFPGIVKGCEPDHRTEDIGSMKEARELFAEYMREYAAGYGDLRDEDRLSMLRVLYGIIADDGEYTDSIGRDAFYRYEKGSINERLSQIIYGTRLYTSVSRLETYARCAYAYFLKYGLKLKEREEYGVEASDMGSIYHGVLEIFMEMLKERGLTLSGLDDDTVRELIDTAVDKEAALYTDAILYENEKNRYIVERMKAVMLRTVRTISYQMSKGSFVPYGFEYEFDRDIPMKDGRIRLGGKIDRVDLDVKDDRVLVKIMDYKSGAKDFSLMCFYKGVQLQMVVYMNSVREELKKEYPDRAIIPAAMLYYHIDDPIVEATAADSDEAIEAGVIRALRTKGLVDDDAEVILSLDNTGNADSDVIPVKRTASGYSRYSEVISREDMDTVIRYGDHKLVSLAERIASGDISIDPKEIRRSASVTELDSCRYCEYAGVCGFDAHMPGYVKESSISPGDGSLIECMRKELAKEENGI